VRNTPCKVQNVARNFECNDIELVRRQKPRKNAKKHYGLRHNNIN
jgi:hypothetical protein